METQFSMVPVAAFRDRRLTYRQIVVLGAICSFRQASSNLSVCAGRDEIAERCMLHPSVISAATTVLEAFGWLQKSGRGGRSMKTTYLITIPETVAESETVTEHATVTGLDTVAESETVTEPVSKTVAEYATRQYRTEKSTDIRSSSTRVSAPDGFAEFWDAYGKKVGKTNAIEQWKKLNPDAALVRLMITAAGRYSATTAQQFRKDPERWIKGRRWEDETEQPFGAVTAGHESIFAGAL